MASATIAETRDRLSAIVNNIVSGAEPEHVIRKRNTPVAKIVPYADPAAGPLRFGAGREGRSGGTGAPAATLPSAEDLHSRAGSEPESAYGMLARYASPEKRAAEKGAWARAAAAKHVEAAKEQG